VTAQAWIYRFGDVEVEPAAHRIARSGTELGVEPKAFAVLVALLERSGDALERDELLDRVWGHRHVTPGVLNRVVTQLRKALGDDAEHPRYIQTLHSLGYRFIGDVQRIAVVPPSQAAPEQAPSATANIKEGPAPARKRRIGSAVFAVAALAIASLVWTDRNATRTRPPASIAILPFTSLSSSQDDGYFVEGLALEMHDALAGIEGLTVAAQMAPTPANRGADAKTVGARLGVAAVLDVGVRREGDRLRINARLSDTVTGYTLWSHSYDRDMSGVFATQSDIANEVVHSLLGTLPGRNEALTRRLTPTQNATAYEAYLKGLQQLQQADAGSHTDSAIGFFSEALAADTGFARAQAGICRSERGRFEALRDADAFTRARAACLRAEAMDPTLGEVNLALAELHRARGEWSEAVDYYAKVRGDRALAPDVYVGMAKTQAAQGRQDLALADFEHALALRPSDGSIHAEIGYQQYLAGHHEQAIAGYVAALKLQPDEADWWSSLGGIYLTVGDHERASKAFERSIELQPNDAVLSNYGELKYRAGDYAAAAALFRRAVALDAGDFLIWGSLGDALRALPETASQAREPYLRAADMAERYVAIKPDDAKALAALGWYRANLGEAAKARELISRSEALGTERGEVARNNAQTLTVLGDIEQARKRVGAALTGGIAPSTIATDPILRRYSAIDTAGETVAR
jgi:Flp pilus assembly protein TadD/TolB-like protein/DNA-binding winged helix-turn-helix (wHTH) protein